MKPHLETRFIQSDTIWEDSAANLRNLDALLSSSQSQGPAADIIVLPETFSSGFSMNASHLAETMDGRVVEWMKENAAHYSAVITGSVIIQENKQYYNRLLWVTPSGGVEFYNKRHLFSLMGEHLSYAPGNERKVFLREGWRICPQICYDLRFPVWCRNQGDYDALVFVANWPSVRHLAWKTLLRARAIENQSYVLGVNRSGVDGNKIDFGGCSLAFDPLGEPLAELGSSQASFQISLDANRLKEVRQKFPFLNDRDSFALTSA
jgi:omega-amidase